MAQLQHIVLVPGFFGFANLGDFTYFGHVRDLLAELGPPLGLEGEVVVVLTEPTASLTRRAAILCETVTTLLDRSPGQVSLVGHSSGGLDARLLCTPGVTLPTGADPERCARAVRALVTVSTPHYGTPLAQAFSSLLGQQLLKLLSLTTIHALRTGRLPISAVLRLAGLLRWGARPRRACSSSSTTSCWPISPASAGALSRPSSPTCAATRGWSASSPRPAWRCSTPPPRIARDSRPAAW